jgi:hypothetical protein
MRWSGTSVVAASAARKLSGDIPGPLRAELPRRISDRTHEVWLGASAVPHSVMLRAGARKATFHSALLIVSAYAVSVMLGSCTSSKTTWPVSVLSCSFTSCERLSCSAEAIASSIAARASELANHARSSTR